MKHTYLTLLLLTSTVATSTYCMDKVYCAYREESPNSLLLGNKTGGKIEVVYRLRGEETGASETLIPHQEFKLKDRLDELEELYIIPYGEWLGKVEASFLSGGLIGQENIVERDSFKEVQHRRARYQLTVSKGGGGITSLIGSNLVSRFVGEVLPYALHEDTMIHAGARAKLSGLSVAFFPQVELASAEDRDILPHYFLNVPKDASRISIDKAYRRSCDQWLPMTQNSNESKRELAKRILYYLEQAYKKLVDDESERYWIMIYKEFHHFIPTLSASKSDAEEAEECTNLDKKYFGPQEATGNPFE